MIKLFHLLKLIFGFFFVASFLVFPFFVFAVDDFYKKDLEVVSVYKISEENISSGDIISYNFKDEIYIKSNYPNDEDMFGVVAKDPLLVFNNNDEEEGKIPIVRSGEVIVNVSTINGEIKKGDFITSSLLAGKGQKASKDHQYVLGIAASYLNSKNGKATTTNNKEIFIGEIPVMIGSLGSTVENHSSSTVIVKKGEVFGFTVANTLPYLVAVIIAFSSIYIAFRNFMPNIKQGLTSIGRNPMAKSSIQVMIIFNAVLILLIAIAGFAFGLLVIILPV